jgi:arylsulfatase A-like enzyme
MSLYSGLYVFNHRVTTNATPIDPAIPTLAHRLRALGYDPVISGYTSTTWSAEGRAPRDPILTEPAIGPEWSTLLPFDGERRRYLSHVAAQGYGRFPTFDEIFDGVAARTPADAIPASPIAEEHSETAWLTDAVIDHIRWERDRPFAVHLSLFKPHPPFMPSARFAAAAAALEVPPPKRFAPSDLDDHPFVRHALDKPRAAMIWPGMAGRAADLSADDVIRARRAYLAQIAEVDFHLGRVLDALEETGAAEETLVVFCADHGEMLGDHRLFGKATFFPEAYHVPLIVADPRPEADGRRGRVVRSFTEGVDVLPTILDWLGAPADPGLDGNSLLGWIAGASDPAPKTHVLCEHDFRNDREDRFTGAMALDRRRRSLSMVLAEDRFHVRFAGLPDLAFVVEDVDTLRCRPAEGDEIGEIRSWGLETQLDHRLVFADNRRTAWVAGEAGMSLRA